MRALPGVASSSSILHPTTPQTGRLIPATADPIPANVLSRPFIGEAYRFDGTAAPSGWVLAQGQTLNVADNKQLFSILGTSGGGDGRTTFKVPDFKTGAIVAVAGVFPTSPQLVAQSGRHLSHKDGLGLGALVAPLRQPKVSERAIAQRAAERRLSASAVRVGRANPVPLSAELAGRIRAATGDARNAALDALTPENRARLESVVQGAVSGRITVHGALTEIMPWLTNGESDALARINDGMIRSFNDQWQGTERQALQLAAATFLISVAITREQARAIYQRDRNQQR
jgi:hypothetical protein